MPAPSSIRRRTPRTGARAQLNDVWLAYRLAQRAALALRPAPNPPIGPAVNPLIRGEDNPVQSPMSGCCPGPSFAVTPLADLAGPVHHTRESEGHVEHEESAGFHFEPAER